MSRRKDANAGEELLAWADESTKIRTARIEAAIGKLLPDTTIVQRKNLRELLSVLLWCCASSRAAIAELDGREVAAYDGGTEQLARKLTWTAARVRSYLTMLYRVKLVRSWQPTGGPALRWVDWERITEVAKSPGTVPDPKRRRSTTVGCEKSQPEAAKVSQRAAKVSQRGCESFAPTPLIENSSINRKPQTRGGPQTWPEMIHVPDALAADPELAALCRAWINHRLALPGGTQDVVTRQLVSLARLPPAEAKASIAEALDGGYAKPRHMYPGWQPPSNPKELTHHERRSSRPERHSQGAVYDPARDPFAEAGSR